MSDNLSRQERLIQMLFAGRKELANVRRNLEYTTALAVWQEFDVWKLKDAANLLVGRIPKLLSGEDDLPIAFYVALSCVNYSLQVLNPDDEQEEYRVDPTVFLAWVESRGYPVQESLRQTVEAIEKRKVVS